MAYEFYRCMHIIGLMLLFTAMGGFFTHLLGGGSKRSSKAYSVMMAVHGLGLVLLVVAGFGMIAKLHVPWGLTNWVGVKTIIWVMFGGLPMLMYRRPEGAVRWLILALTLGAVAATVAIYKPF